MPLKEICYVVNADHVHVKRWTRYFVDKGYFIHLITHKGRYAPKEGWIFKDDALNYYRDLNNVEIHYVSRGYNRIFQTRKLIKKIKPDVVHAHSAFGQGFFGAFSGFHPYIIGCWGWDIRVVPNKSILHREAVKYSLKKADIIHVQDKLSKTILMELSRKLENKIYVQAWGVNTKKFTSKNRRKEIIEKHQIDNGPIVISVRNLVKQYDIQTLFEAMPHIVKNIPNVKFVVLNDGHLKSSFQKKVKEAGIEKNVDFLGFVNFEMYKEYLASADLFVDTFYPYDNRGGQMFGQGLLEAMASGVAQVVANRPTIYEYKGDDRWYFGYTYTGGDHQDLAEKVVKLLKNPDKMNEICEKGRKVVDEKFNWAKNMEKIEKVLYAG